MLVNNSQTTQNFVKQGTDRGLTEDLGLFQIARRDNEILQGSSLQIIHHHVNGFVLPEKVHHTNHRRVGDLRQRAPFFKETLQAEPVQGQLLRWHLGRQRTRNPCRQRSGQVLLDGNLLTCGVDRQIDHAKPTSGYFTQYAVATNHGVGR